MSIAACVLMGGECLVNEQYFHLEFNDVLSRVTLVQNNDFG
jgi:hypothetical protein